jgi:hypothetical protein
MARLLKSMHSLVAVATMHDSIDRERFRRAQKMTRLQIHSSSSAPSAHRMPIAASIIGLD